MAFSFSLRSIDNLKGVHPDLIHVCYRALLLSSIDFGIIEGVRTGERQHELFLAGKSKLDWPAKNGERNGPHLSGKAIDFMAYVNGKGTFEEEYYKELGEVFKRAAAELKIKIHWGGDNEHWKDNDHIELDHLAYPNGELIA